MSKTGATREEGKASVLGEDNPATRRVGSDRMAAMDALSNQRREDVAAEAGVEIAAPPKGDPAKGKDPDASDDTDHSIVDPNADAEATAKAEREARERAEKEEREAQLRAQAGSDDRVVLEGDLSRYVIKTKVDGKDSERTLDQVVRTAQKNDAADQRLEEATRIKKQAEAELEAARAEGNKVKEKRAKAKVADATQIETEVRTRIQAAADALFAGDTAAATENFTAALKAGRVTSEEEDATPQNVDEVADVVMAKVEQKTALRKFATDYSELVASPLLAAMTDQKVKEFMDAGDSFVDALPKAGNAVRDSIKALAKGMGMSEAGGATGLRVERHQRKAEIDEPQRAGAAQASTKDAPSGEGSYSSVIQQMAESRRPKPGRPSA